ncbi:RyR domain-containing protein [Azoarcus taiwanensis]|uniref:Ryanodine receptor Ryr domain-containing protein n=1 Tax=Azoarcus taiwanensis TaxID=666964 RepID=A0A972F8A0_9RHOO|nr:RyR domain-containing protein [Azoarcus taiwanensis]NMG03853.1 hypothetical protein [Azoarcus taiwanensis]
MKTVVSTERSSGSDLRRGEFLPFLILVLLLVGGFVLHRHGAGQDGVQAAFSTIRLLLVEDSANRGDFVRYGWESLWPLYQWLRIAVPVVASWLLVRSYLTLIGSNGNWLLARFWPHNVLILGGDAQGRRLALEHRERGERVAVLTLDAANGANSELMQRGVKVFGGNALNLRNLKWLAGTRASVVYILAGVDSVNLKILDVLMRLHSEGGWRGTDKRSQICLVHIQDDFLAARVTDVNWLQRNGERCQVRVFNVWKNCARRLLSDDSLAPHCLVPRGVQPHVLMLGFSSLGRSILEQLAHLGHYPDRQRAMLTVASPDADTIEPRVHASFPVLTPNALAHGVHGHHLNPLIDISFISAPTDGLTTARLSRLPAVTIAYICTATLEEGIAATHSLLMTTPDQQFPIVLCTQDAVHTEVHRQINNYPRCHVFNAYDAGLKLEKNEPVLNEFTEREAAIVYLHFGQNSLVDSLAAQTRPRNGDSRSSVLLWDRTFNEHWFAAQEWERESSRDVVRHLHVKRHYFNQLEGEISEQDQRNLSELEHQRWCAERLLQGWRYAPNTDRSKRRHASLCAFHDLPIEEQNKDYTIVGVSRLLARARIASK